MRMFSKGHKELQVFLFLTYGRKAVTNTHEVCDLDLCVCLDFNYVTCSNPLNMNYVYHFRFDIIRAAFTLNINPESCSFFRPHLPHRSVVFATSTTA